MIFFVLSVCPFRIPILIRCIVSYPQEQLCILDIYCCDYTSFFFWLNCKLIYVVVSHYLLYISPCIFFIFPLWFSSIQIKLRFFFHIWFLIKMSFYLFIGFFYDPIMHVVILLCMAQKRMRHVMEISHDYILCYSILEC